MGKFSEEEIKKIKIEIETICLTPMSKLVEQITTENQKNILDIGVHLLRIHGSEMDKTEPKLEIFLVAIPAIVASIQKQFPPEFRDELIEIVYLEVKNRINFGIKTLAK